MPWKKEKGTEMNVCLLLVPGQSHVLPPSWEPQGRAGEEGSGQGLGSLSWRVRPQHQFILMRGDKLGRGKGMGETYSSLVLSQRVPAGVERDHRAPWRSDPLTQSQALGTKGTNAHVWGGGLHCCLLQGKSRDDTFPGESHQHVDGPFYSSPD